MGSEALVFLKFGALQHSNHNFTLLTQLGCGAFDALTHLVFTPVLRGIAHCLHFEDKRIVYMRGPGAQSGKLGFDPSDLALGSYPDASRELHTQKSWGCFSLNVLTIRIKKSSRKFHRPFE